MNGNGSSVIKLNPLNSFSVVINAVTLWDGVSVDLVINNCFRAGRVSGFIEEPSGEHQKKKTPL